jgi:phosphoribosylamine--glycine ligase
MPPAQDHKRLLDGDRGPNTGGMGAYAPAPASTCPPALIEELTRTILQPTVDGLHAEGMPFIGVLYAGLMLTLDGPRVLEFNCRFGDPETQAILPLLDSDLLDIAEACVDGRLAETDIQWTLHAGAAACVVIASEGYPGRYPSGREIRGLDARIDNAVIFHAGTNMIDGKVVTAGGRVLGVTGWGSTLGLALAKAYAAAGQVEFEGMQYRRDIVHLAENMIHEEHDAWRAAVSPPERRARRGTRSSA